MTAALNLRKIGGSDVAAILGVSDYSTRFDVWLRIVEGFVPPDDQSPWKIAGKKMERAIGAWWAEDRGLEVEWFEQSIEHPEREWQRFSPDLRVKNRRAEIADVKRARRALDRHGMPGTDEIAEYELTQLQTYLEALHSLGEDADVAHLVVHDLPSDEVLEWHTRRDPDFGALIVEECERFWRDHVVTKKPPELSGSETARAWLQSRYPKDTTPPRDATPAELKLVLEWRDVDAAMKQLGARADVIKNKLIEQLGNARGLRGDFGSISYAAIAESKVTDWEAVARELVAGVLSGSHFDHPDRAGVIEHELRRRAVEHQIVGRKAHRRLAPNWKKTEK